jgi:transposase InsO family protein
MGQRKRPASKAIAFWRYEQIEEALDPALHREARGKILRRLSRTPVRWPSGLTKRIALATLYRWLEGFRSGGLAALQPRRRSDRQQPRRRLPGAVVHEALRLLTEDPAMTFTFLLAVLHAKFEKIRISRSTLQRRLAADPAYLRLQRAKQRIRRRTRFVGRSPHDIWQTDAKGPFPVRLLSGQVLAVHVLSILDDASRAVLAALVTLHADLASAVRAFRLAALRWGLPERLYADRATIFDSLAFRQALAQLGAHRIATRPRNAEAHGKIEAYHRVLGLWFTKRLASQGVVDLEHLQQLLDGVIHRLYQTHRHRGLKSTPEQTLAGRVSTRAVPPTRLYEAFRQERRLKAHPKTGEVEIDQILYLVPDELRDQRLTFLVDLPGELPPLVVHPQSGAHLSLRVAAVQAQNPDQPTPERWAPGPLQALYDSWRGQSRPVAEPGFGLPEIYSLLGGLAGRHVPQSDAEAATVQRLYRDIGPFSRTATEAAIESLAQELGPGRPLQTYLDALVRRAQAPHPNPQRRNP